MFDILTVICHLLFLPNGRAVDERNAITRSTERKINKIINIESFKPKLVFFFPLQEENRYSRKTKHAEDSDSDDQQLYISPFEDNSKLFLLTFMLPASLE